MDAIGRLLELAGAAAEPPPECLRAYAHDDRCPADSRLAVLQLLVHARSGAVTDGTHGGEDADTELMLRLHVRRVVADAWPSVDFDADGIFPEAAQLRTEQGMRTTFRRLCSLLEQHEGATDEVAARTQLRLSRLLALAALITEWRPVVGTAGSSAAPWLHAECAGLLQYSLSLCGPAAVAQVRLALPAAPTLTIDEEAALSQKIHEHGQAAAGGGGAGAAGATSAAARARLACALLSGWPQLEQSAMSALEGVDAPEPDQPLLQLLVRRALLPRLAKGAYWPRALRLLALVPDERLVCEAICALGSARLYGHAGSILLHQRHCHPALHSPAAQLAVLTAYVCDERQHVAAGHEVGGMLRALRGSLPLR
jgi:hypothetical protein